MKSAPQRRQRVDEHWVIVVPRLWGWCRASQPFEFEREARDFLSQFGPLDGKVVKAR